MFNPYALYDAKYLARFKLKGVKAFVKQAYDRGRNMLEENPRPSFLLSHYEVLSMAQDHMEAIKHDSASRLLLLDNVDDFNELQRMGQSDSGQLIYMSFKIPDAELKARKLLDKKLHAYIDYKLNWRLQGGDTVHFSLEFVFGEIYAVLKHGGRYHKVKFEEIETTTGYVL